MGGEETGCFAEVRGVVVNSLPKKSGAIAKVRTALNGQQTV